MSFTDCISEINNTQTGNAKDIGVAMPMESLIEYNDNYWKNLGSSWQYCRDMPANTMQDSESFKSKNKIRGNTPDDHNTKNVEIALPLKLLSNFWGTLEMPLINFKVNLILTWSENCVISFATGTTKFTIKDTKLAVPVVTLSTQDNKKLLIQVNFSCKNIIFFFTDDGTNSEKLLQNVF